MSDADREQVEITSRADLRAWLTANHSRPDTVWLVTYKKHVADKYVPWGEIVQEALCFGWIDSKVQRVDENRKRQLFSPRRPGSIWSRINKEHVARLEAEGRMTDAGRAVIERAKADGSWVFLDDIEALVEPDDLRAALDADPVARATWDGWRQGARKQVLYQLKSAKRPATRGRRLAKFVDLAAAGRDSGL